VLEVRRDDAQLAERPRLELADALTGDSEAAADLLERPRLLAVEAEPEGEHVPHPRVQLLECRGKLGRAEVRRRGLVRLLGVRVLDQVAVEALPVPHRRLERDRVLDEVEQLPDALLGEAALLRELGEALATLNPRMRRVLALRFGLDGELPRTLEQVGEGLGITRERVRQLESRALRELRMVAPGLEFYLRT